MPGIEIKFKFYLLSLSIKLPSSKCLKIFLSIESVSVICFIGCFCQFSLYDFGLFVTVYSSFLTLVTNK